LIFSLHERSKTRQDKFESILEIIESVVSSPFVRPIACSWYIKNRKKPRSWSFYSLFKIFQTRDIIHSEKSGICSDGNRKLEFVVDCTSRDGRRMLDAGVYLSDKRTLLMQTQRPFQTQYRIFYRIRFCFYKWWRNNRFYYF
jgi:hypothetical protein